MSPELQSIITLVVVGLVSFLIGWLLTSSRWKKKYQDAQLQSDQLVSQTTTLSADLNKTKSKLTEVQTVNKKLERTAEENDAKLSVMQRNLQQVHQNSNTDEVNRLKLALNHEKENGAKLKNQLTELIETKKKVKVPAKESVSAQKSKAAESLADKKSKTKKRVVATAPKKLSKKKKKKKKLKKIIAKIGPGSDASVDDLTVITGIGPEISSKLNKMGIVNYAQLSKLEDTDLKVIDKALKFFPGRAYRNNWIGQARVLAEKGRTV